MDDAILLLGGEATPARERFGVRALRAHRLIAAGLPVPPAAALAAEAAADADAAAALVARLEEATGARLGDPARPLLLSVRSSPTDVAAGAPAVLNLGLTAGVAAALAARIGPRAALDLRRRLIQSLAVETMGADPEAFENALYDQMKIAGVESEGDFGEEALEELCGEFERIAAEETGEDFPDDAEAQIARALASRRAAWRAPSAARLRAARGMATDLGLGLMVQQMALGLGPGLSGAGRAQLRSETTGEARLTGRFLAQAQGDDVSMGLRTPRFATRAEREAARAQEPSLEEVSPKAAAALEDAARRIETVLGDATEAEFTLEGGKVRILGAGPARRSPRAAVRIAVDLAEAGAIGREEALLRIDPALLIEHLHPFIDPAAPRDRIGRGLPASPGAASGPIVFTAQDAEVAAARGEPAILVRVETSPEDIRGMHAAAGVLTGRGGMTSHAAVAARGLGAPCVVGASDLRLDMRARSVVSADGRAFREGDVITVDGTSGEALAGAMKMIQPAIDGAFAVLMDWSDAARRMDVRANADTRADAETALAFRADGIGLCRTEHMFFDQGRVTPMREMILADTAEARRAALAKLAPMQREDMRALFDAMAGRPATIRLLDAPLHEFLPHGEEELGELAVAMDLPLSEIRRRSEEMREFNPMLGKRGCRMGISYPEIYEMQCRAIFEAASESQAAGAPPARVEVMVPMVSAVREMEILRALIDGVARDVAGETGVGIAYETGAMIETPRAALRAEAVVREAAFLSFGTNDLTQMTYGLSRDDAGRFMRDYLTRGVFEEDPFHSLDIEGVGELVLLAAERARKGRPEVALGLCGEHGGDPATVRFCELAGFDYVSCSPFRVPIARLAAAQAAILARRRAKG